MVLALIAIWYIAAVAMNWSLVRDAFEREETPYTITDVLAGTMDAERPLLPAPHQVVSTFVDGVFGYPPLAPRSLVYHSLVTLSATLLGFVLGSAVRHRAGLDDRAQPRAGAQPAAMDHLLADGADPGAGADLHRGARRARVAGAAAEIDHLRLSLLFPDHDRHGEGLHLAGSAAA